MRLSVMPATPQALGGERDAAARAGFALLDQPFILAGAALGVRDAGLWHAMLSRPYGNRLASPPDVVGRRLHMAVVGVVHHHRRIEMQDVDGPLSIGRDVASLVGACARQLVRLAGVIVLPAHHAALQLRHTDHLRPHRKAAECSSSDGDHYASPVTVTARSRRQVASAVSPRAGVLLNVGVKLEGDPDGRLRGDGRHVPAVAAPGSLAARQHCHGVPRLPSHLEVVSACPGRCQTPTDSVRPMPSVHTLARSPGGQAATMRARLRDQAARDARLFRGGRTLATTTNIETQWAAASARAGRIFAAHQAQAASLADRTARIRASARALGLLP